MDFVCPKPDALAEIPQQDCPVQFDQIVRLLLMRRQPAAPFTDATIKLLATFTAYQAADDDTKLIATPLFAELVLPQSAALTAGGNDNTTINGIPDYNGEGFVSVTGQFRNISSAVKKVLASYTVESIPNAIGATDLGLIMVTRGGQIIHNNFDLFPVYNWRVSTVGSEGFNAKNKVQFGFDLPGDWDLNYAMVKPNFDPLTQLP